VVARQQKEGNTGNAAHLVQSPHQHLAVYVVRLEHIAAHHHETAALMHGKIPNGAHDIYPGGTKPRPRLVAQVVRSPAKLPVGGMHKPNHTWIIEGATSRLATCSASSTGAGPPDVQHTVPLAPYSTPSGALRAKARTPLPVPDKNGLHFGELRENVGPARMWVGWG